MKTTPIIFNAEMIRALLSGRKTQTRRIINPQPVWVGCPNVPFKTEDADPDGIIKCPYGKPGDFLWVRETFSHWPTTDGSSDLIYRADDDPDCDDFDNWGVRMFNWKPSIFMPRWASRLTPGLTEVRVQRVQDISDDDAKAEGIIESEKFPGSFFTPSGNYAKPQVAFQRLWDSINAKPRPVYRGGRVVCYKSFPWQEGKKVEKHCGLPHYIHGNPHVWALTFEVHHCNVDQLVERMEAA